MEWEPFLNGAKWTIIKHLALAPTSPSALAVTLGTSVANITQQVKLMEAYKLVRKEVGEKKGPGKPKTIYHLNQEFAQITLLEKGYAEKKQIQLDTLHHVLMRVLFLPHQEDHEFILRFLLHDSFLFEQCIGLAYLKSSKEEIELLFITEEIEKVRKEHSAVKLTGIGGKTKKIVLWTHNEQEMREGVERMEPYFLNLLKKNVILKDGEGVVHALNALL